MTVVWIHHLALGDSFHFVWLFLQMHASSGGGFCDCGDVEAWKIGPYCSKHDPGAATAMVTVHYVMAKKRDDESVLEPELYERAEKLFRILLDYVTNFLVWEEDFELSAELQPRIKDSAYYCVLYNDEHHSYDHVIYTLQRSVNCDQAEAQTHTTLIDKEGMEEVKRQLGQHIAVEPEWEAGFTLQIQLRHILPMFQDWCSSDDEIMLQAFKVCHAALTECNNQPLNREPTDFYMCKHILHARPYRVSQEPVSIHLPISRLLAGLYVLLWKTGAIRRLDNPEGYDFVQLAEHPLHCVVLAAQVTAEMWRRNGLSLALHLIGQALVEEKTQLENSSVEDVTFDFSLKAREQGKSLFLLLSKIKGLPSLEAQKDLIKWLLQDKDKAERKRKAEAAKLHRQKIMAQMSAMQKNFIESNKMLYDNMPEPGTQEEPVTSSERSAETSGGKLSALLFVLIEKLLLLNLISYFYFFSSAMEQRELCIAFGPLRGPTPAEREVLTCILCQEEQEVMPLAPAMVLTACVQRSTVLTQCRGRIPANRSDGQSLSVLGIPAVRGIT
ncbi:hypothetical protein GOODEAATRI_012147 [Goodea atripinnis]|uniref:E3 ubiquitin-protein ligase n=1 Tax=Goodea atripinnis TaxID=208336 RepID=A0ABV0NJJ2_9TELE